MGASLSVFDTCKARLLIDAKGLLSACLSMHSLHVCDNTIQQSRFCPRTSPKAGSSISDSDAALRNRQSEWLFKLRAAE
eukprot:350561-Chlamydomonas_euryale.AAC.13